MVWTTDQKERFYKNASQMSITSDRTIVQLVIDDFDDPDDLVDFDEESLKQLVEMYHNPGGTKTDPDDEDSTIPMRPYQLGAKSLRRLIGACELMKYYRSVGRTMTSKNVKYEPMIKFFAEQYKVLKDRKKEDDPDTPKITRHCQ